jgi:hypothetical protein
MITLPLGRDITFVAVIICHEHYFTCTFITTVETALEKIPVACPVNKAVPV